MVKDKSSLSHSTFLCTCHELQIGPLFRVLEQRCTQRHLSLPDAWVSTRHGTSLQKVSRWKGDVNEMRRAECLFGPLLYWLSHPPLHL